MENKMEKEFMLLLMGERSMENGKKVKELDGLVKMKID